ncbi:IPT/TIG domain-containing protein [Nocardia vinacea]|uniref:IPT/TIG domain-containing protein n=1 Tax=Nocardia vinacea TaxID=96468 RepID=A0ABZ1YVX3_9NOCA|nr:IPT/TIG domain-containing protein [Nocardia vinacea]
MPTITSISPAAGPASGNTSVTITGTGFVPIVTTVKFGTVATTFTVNSPTQITAIAPPGTGTVQVTVTTSGGGISNGVSYTYLPVPSLTSVSPTQGPTTGGNTVTLTGTNLSGVTAVSFGGTAATSFTVVSNTQITAVAPAGTGIVQITVTAPGGTSNGATYIYVVVPTITSISPTAGPASGGNSVTVTGTEFTGPLTVRFGTTATTFTVNSSTQLTAIAPPGTGTVQVTVTGSGGPSNGVSYTYAGVPALTSITPSSGPVVGGTTVVLTGTGLSTASAVKFGATPATSFTVNSATQITAVAPAGTGTVQVTVTTAGGTSNGVSYTYVAVPTLTTVVPNVGPVAGGTTVVLTGTNLTAATAVKFGATPATSFTVNSATQITAVAPAGTGTVQVTVTTAGGTSNGVGYTYVAVPTLTTVVPNVGPVAGGTTVVLTGTNLTAATAVKFGATPATSFTVNSATQITAVAPAGTGTVQVTVTTAGGTSNGVSYTYVAVPTLTTVVPNAGPVAGGTTVVLTGTNLTAATAVTFGVTPAISFTVNSATQITAVAPAGTGTVQVTVTTAGGTSNGVGYTYVAVPTLTTVVPNVGPVAGGTTVVLTGTNLTGATAVTFGVTPATSFTVNSATQITAVAPAGTGTVQVTVTTAGGTSNGVSYTYVAVPTLTTVVPNVGPVAGGTTVVLTGTNLTGATAVTFGATPAISFTVNSATQITAVAPAGTGTVQVTVTTAGGTSNGVGYTYVAVPTLTTVVPNVGPVAGGTTVVLTGTNLTGATAVSFGVTPATSFTVDSATQITAVAPAGTGTVQVTATTAGGTSNGVSYTYVAVPTLTTVVPSVGPVAGGTTVVLTGTNLTAATAVDFGATPAISFTVDSATQITAVAPAGTGTVQVTVTTAGGTSNGVGYTYVAVPILTTVVPNVGPVAGGTTVVLTGTSLTGAAAVTFGVTPAISFTVDSATQITAVVPAGAAGTVQVTVTTAGGTSNGVGYTYVAVPTLTTVVPNAGPVAGGTTVVLTGTNLTGATAVTFGATPAISFTVNSATQITAVAPGGTGTVQVTATTAGGTSNGVSYTYVAVPTLTTVVPNVGPVAGGTTVVLTGTNLTGATAVTFGVTPAISFTVDSATQITAVVPAGAAGTVQVTATTAGGTSNGVGYTYVAVPTLTTVVPNVGPVAGGTTVVLTGTNLTAATAVDFGATPAISFTVNSATQITAVAPAGAAGTVQVTVTTAGGTSNGVGYTYVAVPILTTVVPNVGPVAGGTTVVLTGTSLTGAAAVTFGVTPAISFTVDSATQITAVVPAGAAGTVQVTVTTAGGTSNGVGYTYVAVPTLTTVVPSVGPVAGGTTVILTGTNLTAATAVTFGGTPAISFTVNSATQITAVVPAGAAGTVQVTATTAGGTSNGVSYTYVAVPTLTTVVPSVGPVAGGTTVVLTGTNLTGATAVDFGATPAISFTVDSATQITAVAPAGTGTVQVTVTTAGGTSNGVGYTYVAVPTLTTVVPNAGPVAGGTTVVLTGTNLTAATAVTFGATPAISFTVDSATQITAVAPAGTGTVQVTVTTAGGTSNGVGYTYVAVPTLTTVVPSVGPVAGGTTVVLTGTNLTAATAVDFGATPAISFTVDSATQITAVAPAGTGTVQVTVTTAGGTSNGVSYTYVAVPILTTVVPNAGPVAGGTTVVLTGTNLTGATAVSFGATPATSFTVDSATQITAVAPAGAAGTVQVTATTAGGTSNGVSYTYVAVPTLTTVVPSVGPVAGGTTVVLTGTNLTAATAVDFGATPAISFTVDSATQITAVAPAGTGTVQVTVTTVGGTSNGVGYTYVAVPTLTTVVPNVGSVAGGTTVVLTGTNLTGATAVTFGATPAISFTVDSATQITAVAPAGTGTVQVTVTTAGGTSNGVGYTYVAVPTLSGITPSSGPATGGTVVVITGTGLTGATGVTFGAIPAILFAVNSDTQITALVPAGAAGTVQVTVTTAGGTSNGVSYTYVAVPTLSGITPSSGPVSGGTVVVITGTGLTGTTAVNFGATPATSFTVDSATQITAVTPAGTGTVQVTATTGGGTSNGVGYTYVAVPTLSGITPSSGPVSGGTVVVITGTGLTGTTGVTFGAIPATLFTANSDTQITALTPAGSAGTVQVTATTAGGTSNGVSYTYVAVPTLTAVVPNVGSVAGGTTVVLTGTNLTAATAVDFGATPAISFTVDSATQITAVAPAGTGTVQVTATTAGGTSNGVGYTYITVPTLTTVVPNTGPAAGGTTVVLTGTDLTGATAVDFGATPATSFTVDSASQITAVAPAGAAGTVQVTATTAGGTSNGVSYIYV